MSNNFPLLEKGRQDEDVVLPSIVIYRPGLTTINILYITRTDILCSALSLVLSSLPLSLSFTSYISHITSISLTHSFSLSHPLFLTTFSSLPYTLSFSLSLSLPSLSLTSYPVSISLTLPLLSVSLTLSEWVSAPSYTGQSLVVYI